MIKYVSLGLLKDQRNIAVIRKDNSYTTLHCINKNDASTVENIIKTSSGNKIIGYLQEF